MLKISKKTEYALMVLRHLQDNSVNEENSPISVSEISELYEIPFDTASKILQKLTAQSVVISLQGQKGGYALNKTLDKISYWEFISWMEGKSASVKCLDNQFCDKQSLCNIIGPLEKLESKMNEFLKQINLKELLS